LHLKLSSFASNLQLVDQFSYQITPIVSKAKTYYDYVSVFHFFNIFSAQRFFIFYLNDLQNNASAVSITELYFGANWLERENTELFNYFILNKKDKRNLMLCYGDSSAPFKKSSPVIGFSELSYTTLYDSLVFNKISIQL
jgi:NADH:ubiquinone oxidoreductase subunit C